MAQAVTARRIAEIQAGEPLVLAEHLTKVIAARIQRNTILDDVTFTIPAQSLFAINGPSGSGKSTLLNILTGIDYPTAGQIAFGGRQIRRASENHLARWRGANIGIVFQFFQLLPTLTAEENVLLALELSRTMPRAEWRARAPGGRRPGGLGGDAKRGPGGVSGGRQQRGAPAGGLGGDPPGVVGGGPPGDMGSKTAAPGCAL